MEDILLLQFLKKKGIITADDMHEFHELTQYGVNDQMYEKVYLNDEQAWKGCTGYALCDFLPAELPYPDLSIYQPVQKETVSEN